MYGKTLIFLFLLSILAVKGFTQNYTYSYTDPCTHVVKTIQVPSTGITVTYYGQIHIFQPQDFTNGNFTSWTQSVYSSFGGINPCASIVGLPTIISISQNTAINLISITTSITSIYDMLGSNTNMLGGNIDAMSNSSSSNSKKKKDNQTANGNPNNGANTNGKEPNGTLNSQTPSTTVPDAQSPTGTPNSQTPSTTAPDAQSPSGTSKENPINGKSTDSKNADPSSKGSTNLIGGTTNTLSNLQNSESKNGNRPTIIASSDLVGFNFKNSEVAAGGKFTGGYTSLRWDGMRTHGILVDYTTATKGPNITGFYGWIKTKHTDLIATTLSAGLDVKPSLYLTAAYGQLWSLNKKKNFKAVAMVSASYGFVYSEAFVGTSLIAGTMYDWKINKRYQIKLIGLYVYSPYVSYYNDMLLKSPNVVIPIIGTNIGITKRFKININTGGAWAIHDQTLNYTIMMGTRLML
jgi:hypothetical protein